MHGDTKVGIVQWLLVFKVVDGWFNDIMCTANSPERVDINISKLLLCMRSWINTIYGINIAYHMTLY